MAPGKAKPKASVNIVCPTFDPDENNYLRWRKKALIWSKLCTIPKAKQGLTAYMALLGRAEAQAYLIPTEQLESDTGFQILIEKLDDLYMPGHFERNYWLFNELWTLARPADKNINDFVGDFHALYLNYENVSGQISTETGAFMLMAACRLTKEQTQIIKAQIGKDVTYQKMKEALKITLGEDKPVSGTGDIKSESSGAFFSEREERKDEQAAGYSGGYEALWGRSNSLNRRDFYYRGRSQSRGRGKYRGRQYKGSDRYEPYKDYRVKYMNPFKNGKTMECHFCGSRYHLRRQCEEFTKMIREDNKRDTDKGVQFSYFMVYMSGQADDRLEALLRECYGYAIIDCGCPNTVCGERWINNYTATLSEKDCKDIEFLPSSQAFTFGDGRSVRSNRKMSFPVWMGGKRGHLTTDVVDSNIPLLLSVNVMEQAGMILNFKRAELHVHGTTIKLKKMRSGHYALPLSL